jgi:hypothetical protein
VWRNTTNATTCRSAQVAAYQHALAWNPSNPLEILVGNDSGLWRSMDAIGETGQVCTSSDAAHFQNLNGGLGSLAEVESMSEVTASPYTMMIGLGANGTAGVKSTTGPAALWPQILGGEGGPVAIDPTNNSNWYVNNQAGVSIHLCSQPDECTAADFGTRPVIDMNVSGGDGLTMTTPAPFLVDPLDPSQLLVGTCRVWRGPANGTAWSAANAISLFLDGVTGNAYCSGDALIRKMAAMALPGGGEVIYVGMFGAADGGATMAGHVFSATFDPGSGAWSSWQDLTMNPVSNDGGNGMNANGLDISSIYIDPHDATGRTVYVTVGGIPNVMQPVKVRVAYRSTDGGAHWAFITSNLPASPANSLVVDPQDANTAYIATDAGVYSTRQISTCAAAVSTCWSAYGAGLPEAPVVELSAAPATASLNVLAAATYGRGVWQIPLWTAGTQLTSATASPSTLTFGNQAYGTISGAQTVTLTNTGGIALTPTAIAASGDFNETDNCQNATVNSGSSCAIQVTFTPAQSGNRTGQLTISANVVSGQFELPLSGTGANSGTVLLAPVTLNFGQVAAGTTSSALAVTMENSGASALSIASVNASAPFVLASNGCGSSVAANSQCQLTIAFAPALTGAATGTLTVVDGAGTQTVGLNGTGAAAPTDSLSVTSLTFPATVTGQVSGAQTVALTNSGDLSLTLISATVSAGFQTSNDCGKVLPGHTSCAISVVFSPTQTGSQSGTLTVSDALHTQTVSVSGTGLAPAVLGASPVQLSFAAQAVGVASLPLTLTVSNSGGSAMANLGFQITGPSAGSFSTGTTTCGATLSRGSNCTVQVIFKPAATGGNAATLTVSSATLGVAAVQVALSGTGQTTAGINVSPGQMTFAVATVGQTSAAQTATITNTSSVAASGLTLVVSSAFSLTQSTCGTSLAAGASCSVGVVFTAAANGTVAGVLTIGSSAFTTAATVILSGTGGLAGSVQIQPGLLNFPATGLGATSNAQNVTVTNSSTTVALTDLSLTVSSGFKLAGNTCAAALAPGASCVAGVAFAPTSTGSQTGNLTVSSSVLTNSAQVPLAGMGFDFTATASGSSSETVASGQAASYTLALAPLNGAAGTFTFQCGSLPANVTCTFNPTSETVAANTTGSVTVKLATGQSASSARLSRPAGWGMVPMACGVLLLPLAWWRRRKILWFVAVLAMVVGGASSCSGSGGGTGMTSPTNGPGVTPAGTYSIPVTVLSSGASHQVTLTLTVD